MTKQEIILWYHNFNSGMTICCILTQYNHFSGGKIRILWWRSDPRYSQNATYYVLYMRYNEQPRCSLPILPRSYHIHCLSFENIKCLPLPEDDITTFMHHLPSDIYYTRITPYDVDLTTGATPLWTTITTRRSNLMNRLCSYRPQLPKNTGIKWMRLNSGTVNPKCPVTTIQS